MSSLGSLTIVIPTRGDRSTLRGLVKAACSAVEDRDSVVVAANGEDLPSFSDARADVVRTPPGYSSSRNVAATAALLRGSDGVVFIDDDVEVASEQVRDFLRYVRGRERELVSFPVRKEFLGATGSLAQRILAPNIAGVETTSLPATFLYVPAGLLRQLRFSPAFDYTGAEDTVYTELAREQGYRLTVLPWVGPYEVHPGDRTTPFELVARTLAAASVRYAFRHRRNTTEWRLSNPRVPVRWVMHILAGIERASPAACHRATALVARALGIAGFVPVKEGGQWKALRRLRRAN